MAVHDIDRLAVKMAYQLILEQEFGGWGVRIECVVGQYADSTEGQLMKTRYSA